MFVHVPVRRQHLAGGLATTQPELLGVLDFLASRSGFWPQLEVETYTWRALPEGERPTDDAALVAASAGGLSWVETEMQRRGLMA